MAAGSPGLAIGSLVAGRYEILRLLGWGGEATTSRVYDHFSRADVALELVHPDRDTTRALQRLRREVDVARLTGAADQIVAAETSQVVDRAHRALVVARAHHLEQRPENLARRGSGFPS
jgi:hypothetical protein